MDYAVIGAGPAGLQLAYFFERAGLDYVVLETGDGPGTFFQTYPRHRQMISINKPHTGWHDPEKDLRVDWNSLLSDDPDLRFTRYTDRYFPDADDYLRYLADFAHGLNIRYGCRVGRVDKGAVEGFQLRCDTGETVDARRVVVATGFGGPYLPSIPGIETTELYGDVSIDPDDFTDQRIFIAGKGNSAFETADALTERAAVIHVAGPSSLKFAWRTHFIGHLRAVNNNFLDTYQLKTQNMVLDGDIIRIERRPDDYLVTFAYARRDKVVQLAYDRVITCTGFRMDASIFDGDCRPELTIKDRFPASPRSGSRSMCRGSTSPARSPSRVTSRSTPARSSTASATGSGRWSGCCSASTTGSSGRIGPCRPTNEPMRSWRGSTARQHCSSSSASSAT